MKKYILFYRISAQEVVIRISTFEDGYITTAYLWIAQLQLFLFSMGICMTLHNPKGIHVGGGNFQTTQTGSLTKKLHYLLFPKEGYHFHPDALENLVSIAIVSDHHCIVMDTDINYAIYVFNNSRTYIKFQQTKGKLQK